MIFLVNINIKYILLMDLNMTSPYRNNMHKFENRYNNRFSGFENRLDSIENRKPGLTALMNLGNTCYLNSVLQMLSNIPEFKEYFLFKKYFNDMLLNIKQKSGELNDNNIDEMVKKVLLSLSFQLTTLFTTIWKDNDSDDNTLINIKPQSLKTVLGNYNFIFKSHEQQDSHESIMIIFDILESELGLKYLVEPQYQPEEIKLYYVYEKEKDNISKMEEGYEKNERQTDIRLLEDNAVGYMKRHVQLCYLKNKYNKKYSIIDELFSVGQIDTLVCNNCDYKTNIYSTNYYIMLEIPDNKLSELEIQEKIKLIDLPHLRNNKYRLPEHIVNNIKRNKVLQEFNTNNNYSLYDCLNLTFKDEELDFERTCNFCNEKSKNIKHSKLLNIPKYLIITLKRFDSLNNTKKINLIDFPLELDLADYIDNDLLTHLKTNTVYSLISVVNHIGMLIGGHYYNYSRNCIDGKWYRFDDSNISELSDISKIISNSAYILIYAIKEVVDNYPSIENKVELNKSNITINKFDSSNDNVNDDKLSNIIADLSFDNLNDKVDKVNNNNINTPAIKLSDKFDTSYDYVNNHIKWFNDEFLDDDAK